MSKNEEMGIRVRKTLLNKLERIDWNRLEGLWSIKARVNFLLGVGVEKILADQEALATDRARSLGVKLRTEQRQRQLSAPDLPLKWAHHPMKDYLDSLFAEAYRRVTEIAGIPPTSVRWRRLVTEKMGALTITTGSEFASDSGLNALEELDLYTLEKDI